MPSLSRPANAARASGYTFFMQLHRSPVWLRPYLNEKIINAGLNERKHH
jgi:hypothetical protein